MGDWGGDEEAMTMPLPYLSLFPGQEVVQYQATAGAVVLFALFVRGVGADGTRVPRCGPLLLASNTRGLAAGAKPCPSAGGRIVRWSEHMPPLLACGCTTRQDPVIEHRRLLEK